MLCSRVSHNMLCAHQPQTLWLPRLTTNPDSVHRNLKEFCLQDFYTIQIVNVLEFIFFSPRVCLKLSKASRGGSQIKSKCN